MIVNGLLCFLILFQSLKEKNYRYTVVSGISFIYLLSAWLQSSFDLIDNAYLFAWIQKVMLLFLTGYMIFTTSHSFERRMDIPPAVCAFLACIFRFLRSWIFDLYTAELQIPRADAMVVYQKFSGYYLFDDSVTKLALVIMLVLIAWHLGKPKESRN